jgi:hypothetical protein
MGVITKIVGLMSCGFLLCLGLSPAAQAGTEASAVDKMKADQSDHRQGAQMTDAMGGGHSRGSKTIRGEVLRIEGDYYIVKGPEGKEVRVQRSGMYLARHAPRTRSREANGQVEF